ncbi:hypothetical protein D3C87_1471150 [compost metagenome]
MSVGVYLGASILVPLIYGPSYDSTLGYLAILLVKYILWSSGIIIGAALFSLGHIRYNFFSSLIALPIGIVASYLLLERFGMHGVAIAQVISAVVVLLLQLSFANFLLRNRPHRHQLEVRS